MCVMIRILRILRRAEVRCGKDFTQFARLTLYVKSLTIFSKLKFVGMRPRESALWEASVGSSRPDGLAIGPSRRLEAETHCNIEVKIQTP